MSVGKFRDLLSYDWRDGIEGQVCAYCGERPGEDDLCVAWFRLAIARDAAGVLDGAHLFWHAQCAREFAIKFLGDAMVSAEVDLGSSAGIRAVPAPTVTEPFGNPNMDDIGPHQHGDRDEPLYTLGQLRQAWGAGAWAARRGRA